MSMTLCQKGLASVVLFSKLLVDDCRGRLRGRRAHISAERVRCRDRNLRGAAKNTWKTGGRNRKQSHHALRLSVLF